MVQTCIELMDYMSQVGFLPLLNMGIGLSAEEACSEECQYVRLPDGGWEWPLWEWKGQVLRETGCAYGKFLDGKATYISREWWPDFCNYRRSRMPRPEEGTVEEAILATLREHGSLITRELRSLCGFTGAKMRGRFDTYVSRLEMGTYIVTEDFVYPHDRHGHRYGWGWSLLTTPERLFNREACRPDRSPEESYARLTRHFQHILPHLSTQQIARLLK